MPATRGLEVHRCKPIQFRPKRRGVALLLMAVSFLVVGGMVGLAIDVGVLYFLKARLSQAIDAATLAGARSLARGVDLNAQAASAQGTALKFFNANFPSNFWGCTIVAPVKQPDVVVTEDAAFKTRYVTISASVRAPLYFLRVFGLTTATLADTGQAARRDVNIMLIIDRSNSMGASGAIEPTITAATSFVNQFAPTRDKLGMVVFGGDYYLYKPITDFGPTSADPLVSQIHNIKSSGNTNTATALWNAYTALAGLKEPGALNVIVFFTDGLPNGITADMIHTVDPSTPIPVDYRKTPATCGPANDSKTKKPPADMMVGWFSQTSGFVATGNTGGLYKTVTTTVTDPADGSQGNVIGAGTGCQFATASGNLRNDFKQFPAYDYYGTPTWDDPNKAAYYGAAMNTLTQADLTAGLTSPRILGFASQNTADFVAQRWRKNPLNGVVPLVYGITLTQPGAGEKPDPMFMLRVTNTPSGMDNDGATIFNPIYDKSKPTGTYINTAEKDQLQSAFLQIASQILHLSL